MNEPHKSDPTPLGIYDRPQKFNISVVEIVAATLSILWLLGAAVFFMTMDAPETAAAPVDPMRFVITMLAVFMPVAMIWVAATATRASRVMREESQRLQTAIDAIRHAYIAQAQGRASLSEPSVAKKLDEIAAAQRKTETALATFTSTREAPPARALALPAPTGSADDEPVLPLGTTAEDMTPPLPTDVFISAMNFPENVEDKEGFNALRRALKDRNASQLIQAAQDVLTLMSQDGIYMDDLRPDMARPEIWRKFAEGARGRQVAALGGVRDRSSLALSAGRMRQDPIFRDAVHHFLRKFDQMFTQFAPDATDSEISALSDTRTARAFMLLGRVTGTFD
ncbi:MAG: hypothetical protein Q9M48_07790 [Rhodobacterales bacterium]|nr:hypothetical protein [Rhodobacterales bacterium]